MITVNQLPVLSLNLHWPLNGAWSAEIALGSEAPLAVGAAAALALPGAPDMLGRVVRAGVYGGRLRARLVGGNLDWNQTIDLQHYQAADGDQALRELGVLADAPLELDLPFWTRPVGTIGQAVQALATAAGVNWRVNPTGTVRIRAEQPFAVDPVATELFRDDARGLIEIAPDAAIVQPGCTVGTDSVGDVLYFFEGGQPLRCRYWTEGRARLRGALERIVRWITRDAMFLGQYTATVIAQGADGSLDLLPDDRRIQGQGLQSVPIRHGLPGCTVKVAPGEQVLLGFDGGDPRQPYAALWHAGSVLEVHIGGSIPVALSSLVDAQFGALSDAVSTAASAETTASGLGGMNALKSALSAANWPSATAGTILKSG